ncbi:MAG: 1-acyl-sn-glycerol-3-phosphate acyltransferase [Promethearchaeota archaeon]
MIRDLQKIARHKEANPLTRKALKRVPRFSFFSANRSRLRLLMFQKVIYWFFKVRNRLELRNTNFLREEMDRGEPLLLVANHSLGPDVMIHQGLHAHLDHLVFSFISSGGYNYRKIPVIPAVLHFSEQIPRYGTGEHCVDRMVNRLIHGDHVLLFPEGTYNMGLVMEGFTGVARVAYKFEQITGKKLRILPSCSIGGREAYDPHARYMRRVLNQKVKKRAGAKIIVKFGKPFTLDFPDGIVPTKQDYRDATAIVMKRIGMIWGQKRIRTSLKRNRIHKWIKTTGNSRVYMG